MTIPTHASDRVTTSLDVVKMVERKIRFLCGLCKDQPKEETININDIAIITHETKEPDAYSSQPRARSSTKSPIFFFDGGNSIIDLYHVHI
jgi:hypothetical protein